MRQWFPQQDLELEGPTHDGNPVIDGTETRRFKKLTFCEVSTSDKRPWSKSDCLKSFP